MLFLSMHILLFSSKVNHLIWFCMRIFGSSWELEMSSCLEASMLVSVIWYVCTSPYMILNEVIWGFLRNTTKWASQLRLFNNNWNFLRSSCLEVSMLLIFLWYSYTYQYLHLALLVYSNLGLGYHTYLELGWIFFWYSLFIKI